MKEDLALQEGARVEDLGVPDLEEKPTLRKPGRIKFILGGLFILAAVIYLIASSTQASAEYFMTVDELKEKGTKVYDKNIRVSGAVVGESINYDANTLNLYFTIANVPGDNKVIEEQGGLADVLHA